MRAHSLAAAQEVFLSDGYRSASTDRVAATAAVSDQTVHARFGTREALFPAVTRATTGAAIAAQERAAPDPGPDADVAAWLSDHALQQLKTAESRPLMPLRRPDTPDPVHAATLLNRVIMGRPTSEAMPLGAPRFAGPGDAEAHAAECVRVLRAACGA